MFRILSTLNPFSSHARKSAPSKRRGRLCYRLNVEDLERRALRSLTTIDFENLPDGTPINSQYTSKDVVFNTGGNGSLDIFTSSAHGNLGNAFPPHSGENVAFVNQLDPGGVYLDSQTKEWSQIGAYVTGFDSVTLTAYDDFGDVLGSISTTGGNTGTPNILLQLQANTNDIDIVSFLSASDFSLDDVSFVTPGAEPDIAMNSAALTSDGQNVNATYTISGANLSTPGTVDFYWATGPTLSDKIGTTPATTVATATQASATPYTASTPISKLGQQPPNATYILAVADSPSADPTHNVASVAVPAPTPTGSVEIDINNTNNNSDNITLFNPPSTNEPFTQTILAKITNTGTTAGTFQLSVSPADDATLSQTTVMLDAGACTEVTITPEADSSAPNDVHIIATQGGTQVGEDNMTIVSVTFSTTHGTNSLDIRNADTPVTMTQDRIPPFGPASTSITPLYVTVTPDLAGTGQSVALSFLNQTDSNGFASFENGADSAVVTSSGVLNLTGLQQTAPADPNNPSDLTAPSKSMLKLAVQVRGQSVLESHGFSVAAIPVDFESSTPAHYETKILIGMRVNWNLQSDSGNVSDLDSVEESEVVALGERSGVLRYILTLGHSGYFTTSFVIHDFDRHLIPKLLLDFDKDGGIEVDQAFEFRDARTGASDVAIPSSGFIIRQDYYEKLHTHQWFLTTTKAGAPVTIGNISTDAGVIVPPPFLTLTEKIEKQFVKHLFIQLNIFLQ